MDDKDLLAYLRSKFGDDVAFLLNENGRANVPVIPTGIATLDKALGGGIAQGRISEIYGPESSGKTALACAIAGSLQSQGLPVIYIDLEYSLNPNEAVSNGLDIDNLIISQPTDARTAMSILEFSVRQCTTPMVIVVDSVAALVTPSELEASPGSAVIGETARLMSQMMRKLVGITKTGGHVLIFINQLRMKIGQTFGNPETTTGGRALRFYASQRIQTFSRRKITDNGEVVGITCTFRIDKNKVAPPFREGSVDIRFDGIGVDVVASALDVAVAEGIVRKSGGYHYYPMDSTTYLAASRDKTVDVLREDKETYNAIYAQVIEKITPTAVG